MWTEPDETTYELTAAEREVVARAAELRGLTFDKAKTTYSKAELVRLGMVREAFSRAELLKAGAGTGVVGSKDAISGEAETKLALGSPRPSKIGKWQLPLDMGPYRPVMISFPPGSKMPNKTQPTVAADEPGGALRVVLTGSLSCNGTTFGAGEWFFVPNGCEYEMSSDAAVETRVLYLFHFPSSRDGGRFTFDH